MSRRQLTLVVLTLASLVATACGTSPTAPQKDASTIVVSGSSSIVVSGSSYIVVCGERNRYARPDYIHKTTKFLAKT